MNLANYRELAQQAAAYFNLNSEGRQLRLIVYCCTSMTPFVVG